MRRRRPLQWLFGVLLSGGLLAVAYPFAQSLAPSARAWDDAFVLLPFEGVQTGVVKRWEVAGVPLFFLRPDAQQRADLDRLDAHVWRVARPAWRPELEGYLVWGGGRWATLAHFPPEVTPASEWGREREWLGGYWLARDLRYWVPTGCYDYAGRSVRALQFTRVGCETWVGERHEQLRSPVAVERVRGNGLLVAKYSLPAWAVRRGSVDVGHP